MYSLPKTNNNKINLNLNESEYKVPFEITINETNIKLYNKNDSQSQISLENKIKNYNKIDGSLLLTAGSDMALHLIIEVLFFKMKKKTILIPLPTYTHVQLYCEKYFETFFINTNINETNDEIFKKITNSLLTTKPDMMYLVTPNNPTGKSFSNEQLKMLFVMFPDTFFIIDEAYIEFSQHKSLCDIVQNYSNVVVTRTFSKLYGLAGVRLGYLVCNNQFYNDCRLFHNPKEVTTIAVNCALGVFDNIKYYENIIKETNQSKDKLLQINTLTFLNSIKVFPSDGNFLLFEIENKKMFEDIFNKFSISIRDRHDYSIEKCFRITIGTLETTELVMKALNMYGNGFLFYDTFFIDLDETLVENINGTGLDMKFYEDSINLINYLIQNNKHVYIITNNCRYTSDTICEKFNESGAKLSSSNIITPLSIIAKQFKNKNVLFCGNDEQKKYLITNDVNIFHPSNITDVHILDGIIFHDIYSFDYNFIFNFYKFSKDVPVYVSDNDKYFYMNSIQFPDMGSLIEMFNIKYNVLGKPNTDILNGIIYNKLTTMMIGDSKTDYNFSKALGIDFCHIEKSKTKEWIYNSETKCYEINTVHSLYNYFHQST